MTSQFFPFSSPSLSKILVALLATVLFLVKSAMQVKIKNNNSKAETINRTKSLINE